VLALQTFRERSNFLAAIFSREKLRSAIGNMNAVIIFPTGQISCNTGWRWEHLGSQKDHVQFCTISQVSSVTLRMRA